MVHRSISTVFDRISYAQRGISRYILGTSRYISVYANLIFCFQVGPCCILHPAGPPPESSVRICCPVQCGTLVAATRHTRSSANSFIQRPFTGLPRPAPAAGFTAFPPLAGEGVASTSGSFAAFAGEPRAPSSAAGAGSMSTASAWSAWSTCCDASSTMLGIGAVGLNLRLLVLT